MTMKPSKPFNPFFGETYEAYMTLGDVKNDDEADVYRVFCEQTEHHPPISNFLIENELV